MFIMSHLCKPQVPSFKTLDLGSDIFDLDARLRRCGEVGLAIFPSTFSLHPSDSFSACTSFVSFSSSSTAAFPESVSVSVSEFKSRPSDARTLSISSSSCAIARDVLSRSGIVLRADVNAF